MKIDVTVQTEVYVPTDWIETIGEKVLQGEHHHSENPISIIMVDDQFITELNQTYFQKNCATDVISFNLNNDEFPGEKGSAWGEIYISVERAREQASEYHVTYQEEIARLVIHGILHLLGFNDQKVRDRDRMTRKENDYLAQINFDNS